MIENKVFLITFTILMIIISPFLAIIERLLLQLGAILMIFILGIIILTCPILLIAGVVLIAASAPTVDTGIAFIVFSILSPIVLLPVISELDDRDFFETPGLLLLANLLIILVMYLTVGPTNPIFILSLIITTSLVIGDSMNTHLLHLD
tara:strand:- start:246 stop:692 length:447 start_codon:yes stop_codon:yes gene_type:complete